MMDQRHLSPLQFSQDPDGTVRLADFPRLALHTIEEQGTADGLAWQQALGLPYYFEEWEALARIRTEASVGSVTFVLMDASPTRLPGQPRLQPKQILLPTVCSLEFGHSGFIVGTVSAYGIGIDATRQAVPSWITSPLPTDLEGDVVVGQARFYDSALAERALEGLRQGLFTHVCPVIWTPEGGELGTGALVQVSLVPGDFPGCPRAHVLSWRAEVGAAT